MGDTSTYVNTTVNEVDNFANHNLDELMTYFNATLEEAGNSMKDLVDDTLSDINFDEIENITNFIYNVSETFVTNKANSSIDLLKLLNEDVANINASISEVIDGLSNIANDDNCSGNTTCVDIISGLIPSIEGIQQNLSNFDTIDQAIQSITDISNSVDLNQIKELVELVNVAEESLTEFSDEFVNNFTQGITNDIVTITDDIQSQVKNLTDDLRDIDLNNTEAIGDTIDSLAESTDFILYATLVPAIILGVALLLSCFGLILGKQ